MIQGVAGNRTVMGRLRYWNSRMALGISMHECSLSSSHRRIVALFTPAISAAALIESPLAFMIDFK